jgi:hypothetical protein
MNESSATGTFHLAGAPNNWQLHCKDISGALNNSEFCQLTLFKFDAELRMIWNYMSPETHTPQTFVKLDPTYWLHIL